MTKEAMYCAVSLKYRHLLSRYKDEKRTHSRTDTYGGGLKIRDWKTQDWKMMDQQTGG